MKSLRLVQGPPRCALVRCGPGVVIVGLFLAALSPLCQAAGQAASFALVSPDESLLPDASSGNSGSDWTDSHCGQCHQVDKLFSHPLDISPTMNVPDDLPLSDGCVTCLTCHQDNSEAHTQARMEHTPMLRGDGSAASLCAQCHDRAENTRPAQHGSSLDRAHLAWPDRKKTTTVCSDIDSESRVCLSCHDGAMSLDRGSSITRVRLVAAPSGEHAVGALYESESFADRGNWRLTPAATLDRRLRLFDNQVGCTTCHSPFSQERNLLVMSNQGSRLCLSCHTQ